MKPCRYSKCKKPFEPKYRTTEVCCSTDHAIAYARESSAKRRAREAILVANAEKRERRAALKTRKDWLREAQAVFNAMIRERDHFKPCISCGVNGLTIQNGGVWDCGHYRTVGAAPELRFEPLNAHKQCKACNGTTQRNGKYVLPVERQISVRARYRLNLIDRIGLAQVEWLESYHEPLHPSADWLREKIREWRVETRRMREARDRRAA